MHDYRAYPVNLKSHLSAPIFKAVLKLDREREISR